MIKIKLPLPALFAFPGHHTFGKVAVQQVLQEVSGSLKFPFGESLQLVEFQ